MRIKECISEVDNLIASIIDREYPDLDKTERSFALAILEIAIFLYRYRTKKVDKVKLEWLLKEGIEFIRKCL